MEAVEIIRAKRDGKQLRKEEIDWFISAYTRGEVADEQAAALLMAIVWRGMSAEELKTWTAAMIRSGERLDLSSIPLPTSDKHSTGGVGDKVSLILAPLAAASGIAVPMLSGRGLGHTGGTLDKLEAIAGIRVELSKEEMLAMLADTGCVIAAAGPELVPADRKLYALRDVTGTVESIPLIASSIMSKKIAEGTKSLVLDVKVGSGAFLPRLGDARRLAETMIALGEAEGVRTSALITRMDQPLGRAVGNALEVEEAFQALSGKGPADLMEVTLALVEEMLWLTGVDRDPQEVLASGQALERWKKMIARQGGDPEAPLPRATTVEVVAAKRSGYLTKLEARAVGMAAWKLGAGRGRKEDPVSPTAGVVCLAKPGEQVASGQPILELHTDEPDRLASARAELEGAVEIGDRPPQLPSSVVERLRQ